MLGLTVKDGYQWFRMQSWQPVQAELLEAELEYHRGDDSTTYEVVARYRYPFKGVDYENDRVAIAGGADNIGSFHKNVHSRLAKQLREGQTVTAWVNPNDPQQALLNRQFRWELVGFRSLFAVVFGGVGLGLIFAERYGRRSAAKSNALQAAHPHSPWMWRDDWANGEVLCNSKGMMIFIIGFAAFWNAISLPVLFVVPEALKKQEYGVLAALIFPLIGLGLATWATRSFLRYRRFGRSVLRFASVPFHPGGFIDAALQLPSPVYDANQMILTLDCMQRRTTGSGDDRRTSVTPLWQRDFTLGRGALLAAGVDGLLIKLLLPEDARQTTTSDGSDGTFWQLTATAELLGVDYSAAFELPVFYAEGESGSFVDDGELRASKPQFNQAGLLLPETVSDSQLAEQGISVVRDHHGWSLHFARFRNRGVALFFLLFTTIWVGVSAAMWVFKAPLLFPIVFGFFGVLMVFITLQLFLNRSVVRAHRGELLLQIGWFRLRETLVPIADIQSMTAEQGMQSGNRLYYQIKLQRHNGKALTLASGINGLHIAEQLIGRINDQLK